MKLKLKLKLSAGLFGQDQLAQPRGLQAVDKAIVRNGHCLSALQQVVAAQERAPLGLGTACGAAAFLLWVVVAVCTRVRKQARGGVVGWHGWNH